MSLDKKSLLMLHVITKEIEHNIYNFHICCCKMVCLWESHTLDKMALGTYMRLTVNKGIDKMYFYPKPSY